MTARRLGEQYGFQRATANPNEIIEDPEVDAVFVLTRHNLHAEFVVKALEANKKVFTEKPLALSREQLDQIAEAQRLSREWKPKQESSPE